jgi:hypothetical protein
MRSLLVAVMAALLLGLVFSVPLRVNGLEAKENLVEGEITQPREGPLYKGANWGVVGAFIGALYAVIIPGFIGFMCTAFGFVFIVLGLMLSLLIIGIPLFLLGILLFLLGLFLLLVVTPIFAIGGAVVVGVPAFIIGFCLGIENIPYEVGDFIVRLVDACVPG